MFRIDSYLARFKNLTPPEDVVVDICIPAIFDVCGITLKRHEITVQRNIVSITTNPVVKHEILIKKAEILRRIQEKAMGKVREIR